MTSKGKILMNCVNAIILLLFWNVSCFVRTTWFSLRRWNVLWIYLVYFLFNISPTSSHLRLFLTVCISKRWLLSVKFFSGKNYKILGHHNRYIKVIRKLIFCYFCIIVDYICFVEILWTVNMASEGQKMLL